MKVFRFQNGSAIEVTNKDYLMLKTLEGKRFAHVVGVKPLIDQVEEGVRIVQEEITEIVNSSNQEVANVIGRLVLNQLLRTQKR